MVQKERRLQQRFSLEILAKLHFVTDQGKQQEHSVAANISTGGAFVRTREKPPLASRVALEFHIELEALKKLRFILSRDSLKSLTEKRIWVKVTGIVIRLEESGVGIIFDEDYQLSPVQIIP